MSSSASASLANPTPFQLHSLVLDYLCHSCYTRTAGAFNRDSTIRHLDADGDEILGHTPDSDEQRPCEDERPSNSAERFETRLTQVKLRQEIRTHILSGRVDEAIILLNTNFPSVLSEDIIVPGSQPEPRISTNNMDYVSSTSTDPAHLLLNLRILAFSEACRTMPLEYPPKSGSMPVETTSSPFEMHAVVPDGHLDNNVQQMALLLRAQKLLAQSNTLPNPADRATYLEELKNVAGLLAYKIPEKSSVAKYLTLERREAVADQINRAILKRTGLPLISSIELMTRYTHVLWQAANQHGVKVRPGAVLPPRSGKSSSTEADDVIVPPFDLRHFLGLKP